jgi:hypothetical protein
MVGDQTARESARCLVRSDCKYGILGPTGSARETMTRRAGARTAGRAVTRARAGEIMVAVSAVGDREKEWRVPFRIAFGGNL